MRWFTKRSVHISFAALALFIVSLGSLFYFQSNRTEQTGDLVIDSYEVMERVGVLFRQFKDARASVFNYVITGDPIEHKHYHAITEQNSHAVKEIHYETSVDKNLQRLRALTAEEPQQQQQIDELKPLLEKEYLFMDQVAELREKQGFDAAIEFMKKNGDEPAIAHIEQMMLALQAKEGVSLKQKILADNKAAARNTHIVFNAFALALLVVAGTYLLIIRNLNQSLRVEKQLYDISQWGQVILKSSPYAIIAANEHGIIRIYNPAAEQIFGYTATEMIGKETPVLLHDPEELTKRAAELSQKMERSVGACWETLIIKADREGMEEYECTFVRKNGRRLPVLSSVTVLKDAQGGITGYLFIAKDITEQKRMESMKSEFISTVSHELRTPLTSIRGALGLVAGGAVGKLPAKAAELVIIAHKNSERLVRIVNDILDVEKITSGKMQLVMQQVDLSALVRQAIEANQAYAEKHQVKFVLQYAADDAYLMADSDRLMQVMANLLSNAAKFSPEGSEVILRVVKSVGNLRVSVQDHGPGIPEEFRSRIFEKFAQADGSATRGHAGTGLGLSITRKLVEAMGGTVGFTTETGKGSIFYVDMPALADEGAASVETVSAEHEKNHVLVLIVEDNKDIATLLKMLMEQAGFAVDIAYTLAQARMKLRSQHYAAMTLGLTLPDGDGISLIREVRSQPAIHDLPIVVVSATEEDKSALRGDAVGLIDWLVKPIDEAQLVQSLRYAVSHGHEGLARILHVEDDLDSSLILCEMLKDQAEIVTAPTLKEARTLLDSQNFALIILDLSLPDGSGIDLLTYMNTLAVRPPPVLILSASEASADIRAQVAGALVKSRTSETKVVDTILALIHEPPDAKQAA